MSQLSPLASLLIKERAALLRRARPIVGSLSATEDVLQRLWIKIQQMDDTVAIDRPRAFLFRLTSNLAIDHHRAEATRDRIQSKADHYLWGPPATISAERAAMDKETLQRVLDALETLPEPTRTIFRLNRFEGMRIADIAVMYKVSTTTVENHLRRALERLRQARDVDATAPDG